jgi:Predicted membrane protein
VDLAERGRKLEEVIGRTLQGGVLVAALLGVLGGALFLARHGGEKPDYRAFRGQEAPYRSAESVLEGVVAGRAEAIIMLGLLVLIATPIARVALSAFLFAAQRDWTYFAVTLVVFSLLVWSLLSGGKFE